MWPNLLLLVYNVYKNFSAWEYILVATSCCSLWLRTTGLLDSAFLTLHTRSHENMYHLSRVDIESISVLDVVQAWDSGILEVKYSIGTALLLIQCLWMVALQRKRFLLRSFAIGLQDTCSSHFLIHRFPPIAVVLREWRPTSGLGASQSSQQVSVSREPYTHAHVCAHTVTSELAFLLTVQQTDTKARSRFAAQLTHTLAEIRLVKLH